MRVRELARQVELKPNDLMVLLKDLGEHVRTHNSYIEVPVVRRVHEALDVEYHEDRPRPKRVPQPPLSSGLTPPRLMRRRENNPFVQLGRRTEEWYGERTARGRLKAKAASWDALSEDQKWAAGAGRGSAAAFEHQEWKLYGFSETDRDVWTEAGMPVNRAKTASELRDAGVRPTDLAKSIEGWTVVKHIQRGSTGTWIATKLRPPKESAG